jgi:hypothetical protein
MSIEKMSETLFQPRKARRTSHSDNPKTKRNREAEAAKSGFEAAELKARTAFRTSKSRHLAKLHRTPGWSALTATQREDREADVVEELEKKLREKLRALDKLWDTGTIVDGSTENEHDAHDENEHDAHDGSPENMMESKILGSIEMDDIEDDEDAWEDEPEDTFREVFHRYEVGYDKKFRKWEKRSAHEELENNQLN